MISQLFLLNVLIEWSFDVSSASNYELFAHYVTVACCICDIVLRAKHRIEKESVFWDSHNKRFSSFAWKLKDSHLWLS